MSCIEQENPHWSYDTVPQLSQHNSTFSTTSRSAAGALPNSGGKYNSLRKHQRTLAPWFPRALFKRSWEHGKAVQDTPVTAPHHPLTAPQQWSCHSSAHSGVNSQPGGLSGHFWKDHHPHSGAAQACLIPWNHQVVQAHLSPVKLPAPSTSQSKV